MNEEHQADVTPIFGNRNDSWLDRRWDAFGRLSDGQKLAAGAVVGVGATYIGVKAAGSGYAPEGARAFVSGHLVREGARGIANSAEADAAKGAANWANGVSAIDAAMNDTLSDEQYAKTGDAAKEAFEGALAPGIAKRNAGPKPFFFGVGQQTAPALGVEAATALVDNAVKALGEEVTEAAAKEAKAAAKARKKEAKAAAKAQAQVEAEFRATADVQTALLREMRDGQNALLAAIAGEPTKAEEPTKAKEPTAPAEG